MSDIFIRNQFAGEIKQFRAQYAYKYFVSNEIHSSKCSHKEMDSIESTEPSLFSVISCRGVLLLLYYCNQSTKRAWLLGIKLYIGSTIIGEP